MNWQKNKRVKKLLGLAKKYQVSLVLALIGLALIGAGLSISKFSASSKEPEFIPAGSGAATIKVDVEGAVKRPGVYELPADSRVSEAIDKAAGLAEVADKAWVTKNLNLAGKLTDGQKIYIPAVGEAVSSGSVASQVSSKININTASERELDSLPGIGPVTAQKIIAGRPYSSVDELLSKKVVGRSTFEKIEDKITTY